jgi:hypothetical protein
MKLKVKRMIFTGKSTIGELYLDDEFFCYTLEDVVRTEKVAGQTAIPTGTYKVVIDDSVRFKRRLPHILDVPNFVGVRIHPGNSDVDTEGCILVGKSYKDNWITESRVTFDKLFEKMDDALSLEITIE